MPYASATMDSSSCCSNLWVARQSAPARMNWDTIIRSYSMHSASQEVTGSNRFIGAYSALTREVKKSKIWIEGETYLFQIYIRQWIMSLMTFNPRNLPSFIFSDAFQYFCRFTWSNNKKIIMFSGSSVFPTSLRFRRRQRAEEAAILRVLPVGDSSMLNLPPRPRPARGRSSSEIPPCSPRAGRRRSWTRRRRSSYTRRMRRSKRCTECCSRCKQSWITNSCVKKHSLKSPDHAEQDFI